MKLKCITPSGRRIKPYGQIRLNQEIDVQDSELAKRLLKSGAFEEVHGVSSFKSKPVEKTVMEKED